MHAVLTSFSTVSLPSFLLVYYWLTGKLFSASSSGIKAVRPPA
jgi:hypothetical protein